MDSGKDKVFYEVREIMPEEKILKPTVKEKEILKNLFSSFDFKGRKPVLRRTSSRICLSVEHGDYNGTDLFGGAIGNPEGGAGFIWFLYVPDEEGSIEIASLNFTEEKSLFRLGEFKDAPIVRRDTAFPWTKFPMGVNYILQTRGYKLTKGIRGVLIGSIPEGGLSRSASLSLNLILSLLEVNGIEVSDPYELIDLAQAVENEYIGSPCGKLDQAMILLGRAGEGVFYSPRRRTAEQIKMSAEIESAQVVIMDTGTKRSGLQGTDYQVRQKECGRIADVYKGKFGIEYLADLAQPAYAEIMSDEKDGLVLPRLKYVFEAKERLPLMVDAWKCGNLAEIGRIIDEDGRGLRDDYDLSGLQLETMVSIARADPDVMGARMSGGGRVGAAFAIRRNTPLQPLEDAIRLSYPRCYPGLRHSIYKYEFVDGIVKIDVK